MSFSDPVLSRRAGTALLALLATLVATLALGSAPAQAAPKGSSPGAFTGYAFDTCAAPSQAVMDAWWQESPYAGVGIYLGGSNRLCDQPELTPAWVGQQVRTGWRVLPLWVGPQASCTAYADRMAADRPTAYAQGAAQAALAVQTAQGLGIGPRSTLYYDLEDYDIGPDDCRRAALSFLSGWTDALHGANYRSGVYSNIAAAITSLDYAQQVDPTAYSMPDDVWFAWANGRADTVTDARVQTDRWDDHARIHQYLIDVPEEHGGYPLTIDANWVDVGGGSTAPKAKDLCRGVEVDLRRYPTLKVGKRGPGVEAAQCVLRKNRFLKAPITGRYDARTVAAVRKAQARFDLKRTGKLTRPTWAALLARGKQPVLKVGSSGEPVLRLQRSLTAALGKRVQVEGVYTQQTARAVAKLQRTSGLPQTGVTDAETWATLSTG
jgi:peptidoglycan hydrolase-like protein with peptidoglycan-binding domain